MATEKLKKYLNYLFIDVDNDKEVEKWARVGKSTEWTDTMNAKTTTYEYIEDSGPTDVIESYQPSTSMPLTAFIGDPIYEYIFDIYHHQETDARTKMLRVFQNKEGTAYKAQMADCTIKIDNFNFATGVITFLISQSGTPVYGTATVKENISEAGETVWVPAFTKIEKA